MATTPCFVPVRLPLLLFFISFFALHQVPLQASDTIAAKQSLSGDQKITSENGTFVLRFFTPQNSSFNNYYVGILYNKIPVLTPVWVANREIPVTDPTTSKLKIADDGNLVLLNRSKAIVWSTNASVPSNSDVAAILTDDGNLQLRDASNSTLVFWQSFDHPTDTWLPGAKLGRNKFTNQPQRLVAWRSKVDPAPGFFSLEMDSIGKNQFLLLWNMSNIYWKSGIWNGRFFASLPEMDMNAKFFFDYQFVTTQIESYWTFTVKKPNFTTRAVIDYDSGQIQQSFWLEEEKSWIPFWVLPRNKCSVFTLCGPFGSCKENTTPSCNCVEGFTVKSPTDWQFGDRRAGCVRSTPLQCGQNGLANSDKDGFFKMPSMRLPDKPQALAMVGSREECELACFNNCSCNAYSYNSTGCFVWHGELLNLQEQYYQADGGTLYLRLAASELEISDEPRKKGEVAWFIIAIAGAALTVSLAIVWIVVKKRPRSEMTNKSKALEGSLVSFTFGELQRATKNFSEKLGSGSFGSVFKGSLPGAVPVAVKKLHGFRQGEKQFRTEVSTIGTIQHMNLVRLLGFCSQGSNRLLVYEFMLRGSLDTQLFSNNSNVLDWKKRYQIAVGTAKGLVYLHEQCRDCIIHCDIKPENILLDASFIPKVADFGLAKLMGREFSRVLTTMRGTPGYLAPEWITGVAISAKADVYSYGMMLFEIITGKRNLEKTEDGCSSGARFLPRLVASKLIGREVECVLDEKLVGDADLEEVERVCRVACWCVQDEESCRPTMGQVVQVLEGIVDVNMPPIPRSLLQYAEIPEPINFFLDGCSNQSSNTASSTSLTKSYKSSSCRE